MRLFLALIGCLLVSILSAIEESETDLVYVTAVMRHGARAPSSIPAGFSNCGKNYWNKYQGLSQLTPKGMIDLYKFGRIEANFYKNFLPKAYDRNLYKANAANDHHIAQSALVFSSGLYSPSKTQTWNKRLNWMPIPINAITDNFYQEYFLDKKCEKFSNILEKKEGFNDSYNQMLKDMKPIIQKLMNNSMAPSYDYLVNVIADQVENFVTEGCKLSNWARKDRMDLIELINNEIQFYASVDELAKIAAGNVLYKLLDEFDNQINNKSQEKFRIYVTSFRELQPLLGILSNFTQKITYPQYGATLFAELRKDISNNYYVKFAYKNNPPNRPISFKTIVVPGCEKLCPLTLLKSLVNDKLVTDQADACEL